MSAAAGTRRTTPRVERRDQRAQAEGRAEQERGTAEDGPKSDLGLAPLPAARPTAMFSASRPDRMTLATKGAILSAVATSTRPSSSPSVAGQSRSLPCASRAVSTTLSALGPSRTSSAERCPMAERGPDDRLDAHVWALTELGLAGSDLGILGKIDWRFGIWHRPCGHRFSWGLNRSCLAAAASRRRPTTSRCRRPSIRLRLKAHPRRLGSRARALSTRGPMAIDLLSVPGRVINGSRRRSVKSRVFGIQEPDGTTRPQRGHAPPANRLTLGGAAGRHGVRWSPCSTIAPGPDQGGRDREAPRRVAP